MIKLTDFADIDMVVKDYKNFDSFIKDFMIAKLDDKDDFESYLGNDTVDLALKMFPKGNNASGLYAYDIENAKLLSHFSNQIMILNQQVREETGKTESTFDGLITVGEQMVADKIVIDSDSLDTVWDKQITEKALKGFKKELEQLDDDTMNFIN